MELENKSKFKINADTLSHFFFYLGVILKQFYLLPSGSFQIGDICLVASFIFVIGKVSKSKFGNNENDRLLLLFIILVFVINTTYMIFYLNSSILMSALYYLFNFLIVLSFRENSRDRKFLIDLQTVLKLSILLQLLIYIIGRGRWYAGSRYMGTFNDPNQFGFYIFSASLLIYSISAILKQKNPISWLIIMFWLVLQSASTGIAVGVIVFFIIFLFSIALEKGRKSAIIFISSFLIVIVFILVIQFSSLKLPSFISDSFMYSRIEEKINKIFNGNDAIDGVSSDRGWFLLKEYWYMIFYGAGEFNGGRFSKWYGEIHSSIFSPLFYYGIVPFFVWMKWCFTQFKGMDKMLICVYVALLCESITLVNTRQPFFWMLLAIPSLCKIKDKLNAEERAFD